MTPHPDSCPDRLSELAALTQGTAGIPSVIPTKCRDMARRPPCGAESRQIFRRNGGITGARRDRSDSTRPTSESRHQSRHHVAIIPPARRSPSSREAGQFWPIPAYSRLIRHHPRSGQDQPEPVRETDWREPAHAAKPGAATHAADRARQGAAQDRCIESESH